MSECEICGQDETPVRLRRWLTRESFYDEAYLCAACWLDVMTANSKERQIP